MSEADTQQFDNNCNCPVHRRGCDVWERPLGITFSNLVKIGNIPYEIAGEIYENHHSYIPKGRTSGTPVHHGVYIDGCIVGAISYSYELISADIRGYSSDEFMGVSRVCIVVNIPNLASCAMSKSQDKFVKDYACKNNIQMLVTYIIDSKRGSMFKALSGKGWEKDMFSEGHQAGNRPDNNIRNHDKWRWVCELDVELEKGVQSKFGSFGTKAEVES